MNSFKDEIIDDMFNAYLTVKFELIKHLRRKRLLITLILATLIPLLFYIITKALSKIFLILLLSLLLQIWDLSIY